MCVAGFDAGKLGDTLFQFFGPGTVYEKARQQSGSPIQGPWTNHCLKIMIANRENGVTPAGDKNSKDPDGTCKAVALVGLLTDVDSIMDKVTDCVKTAQVYYLSHSMPLHNCPPLPFLPFLPAQSCCF